MIEQLLKKIIELEQEVDRLRTQDKATWKFLTTPLTSTSWDGDWPRRTPRGWQIGWRCRRPYNSSPGRRPSPTSCATIG